MTVSLSDSELLARLVAFDSTSANSNLPIADFVCDYLTHPNVKIARNFNEDKTKVNVVACVPGSQPSRADKGLTLSGHFDVVPASEPDWITNPFEVEETDSAFIGRGVCDMKGFDALAVNSLRTAAGHSLNHPLAMVLTFDEEPGILGAQHLMKTWDRSIELPVPTIVGEPTQLKVVRMHKGHLKMRITFRGRSAHTGYAHLGKNAIEPAGRVVVALTALHRELQSIRSETSRFFPDSPNVNLTVTMISGGTATNIVPDQCVLNFGLRLMPDMRPDDFVELVRTALESVPDLGTHRLEVAGVSAPFLTSDDSPLCKALYEMVAQSTTHAVSYASDAGVLQQMGMQCVLFGPGSIEVAHKSNEWLPRDEFESARVLLDQTVKRFCTS